MRTKQHIEWAGVILAVAVFGGACNLDEELPRVHQPKMTAGDPHVSLIALIGNPEHYDGTRVVVEGFCSLEFEGTAIYLHRDDYDFLLFKNALWLELTSQQPRASPAPHRQYCLVEGTFDRQHTGHLNAFAGAIKNLTRLEGSLSREQLRKGPS